MNENRSLALLLVNLNACGQRIAKLNYSLEKNRALFPLAVAQMETLGDDQEEAIDALILRYSQCVSMLQDHIFRSIAYVEQEDIGGKSNRDRTYLMEKLGAITSADEFGTVALLRNKFSHHYPEDVAARIERLNLIIPASEFVIRCFHDIVNYLQQKGFMDAATDNRT